MREPIFVCSGCGKLIFEGDSVTHILGEQWCAQCINKATETAVKVSDSDRE